MGYNEWTALAAYGRGERGIMVAQPAEPTAPVELTRRRFTVSEYLRMAEVGLLTEDDAVELIQGEIVEISPINVVHASTVKRLIRLLTQKLGSQVILGVQDPVRLTDQSLPQPDIAVLRERSDFYGGQHPGADAVLLIIEVADTSLEYDRNVKSALYASAGIDDYWIVNLRARRIEVYREPSPTGYRAATHLGAGETLSLLAFPDILLPVDDVLGP